VHNISWDGKDNNGNTVADGSYSFQVTATANGSALQATALNYGQVQSVSGDSSGVLLDLADGRTANVNDVRRIL
jgi:flagellar basal-body rod modification protein FlgD